MKNLFKQFSLEFSFELVSEKEIKELEQTYYQLNLLNNNTRQQQITLQSFSNVLSSVLPSILIPAIFEAFDENRDGKIFI